MKEREINDMNAIQKILMALGVFYIVIGGPATIICGFAISDVGPLIALPLLFLLLGIAFVAGVMINVSKKKKIRTNGHKYAAKIYSYVDNTSYTVNGQYTVNVVAHYFDEQHVEKEAIIPTSFARGSGKYPIGMTMDIYEYQGKFSFDPKSVRDETLPGEMELMDDKPVGPDQVRLVAVTCPSCGASFQAAAGYSSRCPYCGSYQNV